MKKKYSRKFIYEAIAYWKKQLRMMNESEAKIDAGLKKKAEEFLKSQLEEFTRKYNSIKGWGSWGVGYPAKNDWICDSHSRGKELADAFKKFAEDNGIDDLQKLASYVRYAYICKPSLFKSSGISEKVLDHFIDIIPYAFDHFCHIDIGRPDKSIIDSWS